jgi:hypothetical protein
MNARHDMIRSRPRAAVLLVAAALAFVVLASPQAHAASMGSPTYDLTRGVFTIAGGTAASASFSLKGGAGAPSATGMVASASYTVQSGSQYVIPVTLSVTLSSAGTGVVTSAPDGISCGASCSAIYNSGTMVTLTASPSASSDFAGWSGGGCSGTGTCVLPMSASTSVDAAFNLKTFTLTASAGAGGSISPSGALGAVYGGSQTFIITPDPAYFVEDVLVDGLSVGAVTSYTFTGITASHTITASFVPDIALACPDQSGLQCLTRTDGGNEADNLSSGIPSARLIYEYSTVVSNTDASAQVTLHTAQRIAPADLDFYPLLMACTGDFAAGATCTYTTELGPAPAHWFYFTATDGSGRSTRYPASGYIAGPAVEYLNGFNLTGVARDAGSVALNGITAFGSAASWRWIHDPTIPDGGYYDVLSVLDPLATGEGCFVDAAAAAPPISDAVADVSATEYAIPVKPGWNLITNPYGGNVLLDSATLRQGVAGSPVAWIDAATAGVVVNAAYTYNGDEWGGTYTFNFAGGGTPAYLVPWIGYWVEVTTGATDYYVVIPRPE